MGVWKGWYEQDGSRQEMRIQKFKVKDSKISGKGHDAVGEFEILGYYTASGSVHFIKKYKGAHEVHYNGQRDKQTISGKWTLEAYNGGFHLYKEREWQGHYSQGGSNHEVKIEALRFKSGKISGNGEDTNGKFVIDGHIQHNGQLEFVKQYIGKHAVHYKGQRNYNQIVGQWSIPEFGMHDLFELNKVITAESNESSDSE